MHPLPRVRPLEEGGFSVRSSHQLENALGVVEGEVDGGGASEGSPQNNRWPAPKLRERKHGQGKRTFQHHHLRKLGSKLARPLFT